MSVAPPPSPPARGARGRDRGGEWGGGRWVCGLVGREGGQEAGAAQALGREGPAYLA